MRWTKNKGQVRFCYIFATVPAAHKKGRHNYLSLRDLEIAGGGFEPPTSGLWAN